MPKENTYPASRQLSALSKEIIGCTACPRLIEHCRNVAVIKRRAYRDETYWGKPVPGFGDPTARLVLVGLAPGAHGANRTGRVFTGDRSGDFLFAAMHATGFANQPTSTHRDDGLQLIDSYITVAGRCAPPDNKPTPQELATCRPFLLRELDLLQNKKVILCLGRIALDSYCRAMQLPPQSFGHNLLLPLELPVLCSYHPSQQNTQTGRLTMPMFEDVFRTARELLT